MLSDWTSLKFSCLVKAYICGETVTVFYMPHSVSFLVPHMNILSYASEFKGTRS